MLVLAYNARRYESLLTSWQVKDRALAGAFSLSGGKRRRGCLFRDDVI